MTKKIKDKFIIFGITGNLDLNNVKFVKKIFEDELGKGTKYIAIDMRNLNYIDSSGIGSFINLMTRLRNINGQIVLYNMRQEIERIFSMTKLLAFFKIFKTEDDFYSRIGELYGPEN